VFLDLESGPGVAWIETEPLRGTRANSSQRELARAMTSQIDAHCPAGYDPSMKAFLETLGRFRLGITVQQTYPHPKQRDIMIILITCSILCFVSLVAKADESAANYTNMAGQTKQASEAQTNAVHSITIDGVVYEDYRFGRVTPSEITIFHKTGVATIPLAKMPPDLQKQFGYDPEKATQWQTGLRKAEAEREALKKKLATVQHWSLTVEGVVPDGIVATGRQLRQSRPDLSKLPAAGSASDYSAIASYYNNPFQTEAIDVVFVGYPKRNELADGNQIAAWAYRDGVMNVNGRTLEKWVYCEPPPQGK
jgi:hypothetical protein